jgi:hypothetical protein
LSKCDTKLRMEKAFKNLTHDELHSHTVSAATDEKNATLKLLEYLAEIDRRRLYAIRGYSSLWSYVHRELNYSEAQASERIAAMRLMVRVPEVREEMEANRLTLTAAAKLSSHVRRERNDELETLVLLDAIQGKSTREVERVLASQASEPVRVESMRPISAETTRILMDVDQEFLELLKQVRELQGHFGTSTSKLIQTALKGFVKMHPKNKGVTVSLRAPEVKSGKHDARVKKDAQDTNTNRALAKPLKIIESSSHVKMKSASPTSASRAIPVSVQQAVRARSGNQCEFIDPQTQRRCDCRVQLEFDHRVPFMMGGLHTVDNLRHYCRAHNQLAAVRFYGVDHMNPFLKN